MSSPSSPSAPRVSSDDAATGTPPPGRGRVLLASGAVVLVIAAVAVVLTLLGQHDSGDEDASTSTTPAYFLGETPTGLRLYAEPRRVSGEDRSARVLAALRTLSAGPQDVDYRTAWPAGAFRAVTVAKDRIEVRLAGVGTRRAPGTSPAEAALGVQQAVYTADAAAGAALPLAFTAAGESDPQVLGLSVSARVARDSSFALTAPVGLDSLADGTTISGSLDAAGSCGAEVTTVHWQLARGASAAVRSGTAHCVAPSSTGALATPTWSTGSVDLSGVAPGSYLLTASTTATGQTSAADGNFSDTRRVTVK